ncbi:MAG: methylenetetrahydrofolate reductase [Clostridia bacterium]
MKTNEMFGDKPIFSAELFPPKKSGNLEGVIRALRDIAPLKPNFVSITYGAGGEGAETTADVASIAKDAFNLETVAHMTAVNMTIDKLETQLEILKRKEIENILVLRGDITANSCFYNFKHASDLALYIKTHHPDFNLIGACYPEKHQEATSLDQDIDNLKIKVDCGISQLITQLFYDNQSFYVFREKLAKAHIFLPLEAGIMPIASRTTVTKTVALSGAKLPSKLQKIVENQNDDELKENGINFAIEQIGDLIANGVQGIHLYTMNKAEIATRIFSAFKELR